jgi:hypothetical protein
MFEFTGAHLKLELSVATPYCGRHYVFAVNDTRKELVVCHRKPVHGYSKHSCFVDTYSLPQSCKREDALMRRSGGYETDEYEIENGGLVCLPSGHLAIIQWFPDASRYYGHSRIAQVDGRTGEVLAVVVPLREATLSNLAVSGSRSGSRSGSSSSSKMFAAVSQSHERHREYMIHVFDMGSHECQPWSLLYTVDSAGRSSWSDFSQEKKMLIWGDALVLSDSVDEKILLMDMQSGDGALKTIIIGDTGSGCGFGLEAIDLWQGGLLYTSSFSEDDVLLYIPSIASYGQGQGCETSSPMPVPMPAPIHTGVPNVYDLCVVPDLGILIETWEKDDMVCVLKLFASADDIAMASMSDLCVGWMSVIVRRNIHISPHLRHTPQTKN